MKLHPHVIIGAFVAAGGLIIEHLANHLSWEALSLTILLALLASAITALFCKINLDTVVEAVRESIKVEIARSTETMQSAEKQLRQLASFVDSLMSLTDERYPLAKALLTEDQTKEIESENHDQIYVVTRDLAFDKEIQDVVSRNLRRNVKYVYFMPDNGNSDNQVKSFLQDLALDPDTLRHFDYVLIPTTAYLFATDLVVYDPGKPGKRKGYVRLPFQTDQKGVRAVLIRDGPQLSDISACLSLLFRSYKTQRENVGR